MAQMKLKTKMNLLFIALKLLLCIAIMVSSTLALFTDSDSSSVCVTAGDVEVSLLQWTPDGYKDISERKGDVFGTQFWEPGQTRIVYLKVVNGSDIPIKYILNMTVSENELGGAFEYCAFPFEDGGNDGYELVERDWSELSKGREVFELKSGTNEVSDEKYLSLGLDGEICYALAIHMIENSSKSAENKSCVVDIHLFAVQGNANNAELESATIPTDED